MTPEVQAFASGFLVTLLHAVVSLAILFAAVAIYAVLSPHKEVAQVRDGNGAAAIALAGVILSLAAPLAVSLSASPSLLEIGLWGLAISAVQLLLFRIVDVILKGLPARVDEGDMTAAGLLTAAKLATALILAAAVAG
jgi:putative membrane protein